MDRFWETKSLEQMSQDEWESLCDGCALCCLVKLEDDSGSVHYTSLVCDRLDLEACRCTCYTKRHRLVKDCVSLSPEEVLSFDWLPRSCAYRVLAEGRSLESWHPLISGRPESVHEAGISIKNKVIPVGSVHEEEHENHVIEWVEIR